MQNFLEETAQIMIEREKSPVDIVFIGSESSGHSCSWEEFTVLADRDYDPVSGSETVASDLIIVFTNGDRMYRVKSERGEWWEFTKYFQFPKNTKPIVSLFGTYWNTPDYGDTLKSYQEGKDNA